MKKVIKLTESDLTRIVKRVINENRFNSSFSEFLKKLNIKSQIVYVGQNRDGYDDVIVSGDIYLRMGGELIGSDLGYGFTFKVGEDNQLIFDESFGNIDRIYIFKGFPSGWVMEYFRNKVKNYIQKMINNKSIPL
jgi:hypothetical protein